MTLIYYKGTDVSATWIQVCCQMVLSVL
jgi:hypothetical protein